MGHTCSAEGEFSNHNATGCPSPCTPQNNAAGVLPRMTSARTTHLNLHTVLKHSALHFAATSARVEGDDVTRQPLHNFCCPARVQQLPPPHTHPQTQVNPVEPHRRAAGECAANAASDLSRRRHTQHAAHESNTTTCCSAVWAVEGMAALCRCGHRPAHIGVARRAPGLSVRNPQISSGAHVRKAPPGRHRPECRPEMRPERMTFVRMYVVVHTHRRGALCVGGHQHLQPRNRRGGEQLPLLLRAVGLTVLHGAGSRHEKRERVQ